MKVLLVRPEESRTKYNFKGIIENEPLDLEIISSVLKDDFDVHIFDLQIEEISFKEFINNNYFDVCYIEGRCFQETFMIEYGKEFKNKYHNLVIVGGQHAQINYQRFMIDEIDYILTGYNYYDLKDIINGNTKDIKNLCINNKGTWIINDFEAVDINNLPLADRSHFYNHPNNYQYLDLKHALWLRTSFSCPYKCEFCIRRKMNMSKYSRRNVYDVIEEIKNNDNEVIYIVDDDFLIDIDYINIFIDEIKKYNLNKKFICYGRSDFISNNEEIMKRLKEIGLYYVLVGLEDVSNLDKYNKLNNIDNNERCIKICQKYDINLMAMFILGLDFKKKDFNDLYKYIKEKDLRHVAVSIYTPELGLNHNYEYIDENPELFDYFHLVSKPKYLSVKKYYFYYYLLLIKLFLKGRKDGIYDFIDYGYYIRSFIKNIFKGN